jgi:transmembrane sensor
MKQNHIYEIIGKYLANEIDNKEKEIIESWLNESEENVRVLDLHKKAWQETRISFQAEDAESVFKNLLSRIDDQQEQDFREKQKSVSNRLKQRFIIFTKIAASLLLLVSVWYVFQKFDQEQQAVSIEISTVEKQNLAGQKSKIYLPDGSVVWLNAESKITFPEKFADEKREIHLSGEAFFDVIKNPDQPFIVKSGNVSTTVLGTSFNVRVFDDEPAMSVALESGKVKVVIDDSNATPALFLEPGESIKYRKEEGLAVKEKFDREQLLSWKDGIIVFKDADLEEIFNTLARWYGVKFTIKNKINEEWTYTGSFDNETLENVLRSISYTKEFTYAINQKSINIQF